MASLVKQDESVDDQSELVESSGHLQRTSLLQKLQNFRAASPFGSTVLLVAIGILLLGLIASVGLVLNQADNRSHASGTITLSVEPKPQIDLSKRTITFFVHLTPSGDNPPQVAAAKLHMLISSKLLPIAASPGLSLPTGELLSFVSFTLHNPHAFPLEGDNPSGIVPFSEASPSATPPPGCHYSWTECPKIACIEGHPCPTCSPKPTIVCTTTSPTPIPTTTSSDCIPVSSCIYGNPGCVVPLPPVGKTYCPLPTPVPPTPTCTLVAYGNEAFCQIACKGHKDTTSCPAGWGCFDTNPNLSGVCVPNTAPTPTPSCIPVVCPSGQHCELPAVTVGGRQFCLVTPTPTPNKVLGVQTENNQQQVFGSGHESGHLYYSVGNEYTKTVNSDSILADITFHLAFPFPDRPSLEQKDIDTYAKLLYHNFNLHIAFAPDTEVYILNQTGNPNNPFVKAQFTAQPIDVSWESIFGNITPTPTPPTGCYYVPGACTSACVYGKPCPPCPTPHLVCTTPTATPEGATKFQTYVINHDTDKGIDGIMVDVTDTSPEGNATTYKKASIGGGAIIIDTFVGHSIRMTVASTLSVGESLVPQTIGSLVHDYNSTTKEGCGELNNSCIIFGYGFSQADTQLTLPLLLACIDLNKPMSDPSSNYNSSACKAYPNRAQADLNKDGWINGVDLNIYYRSHQ